MNSNQNLAKWPRIVLIAVIIIVAGFFTWQYYQKKNVLSMTTSSIAPTAASDLKTYTNDKYGFQLTFNQDWNGYQVEQLSNQFDATQDNYLVTLPDTDVTKKRINALIVEVDTLSGWDDLQKNNGRARDTHVLLGKNDKFAFSYYPGSIDSQLDLKNIFQKKINNTMIPELAKTFKFIK